jgi:hypothetical protein
MIRDLDFWPNIDEILILCLLDYTLITKGVSDTKLDIYILKYENILTELFRRYKENSYILSIYGNDINNMIDDNTIRKQLYITTLLPIFNITPSYGIYYDSINNIVMKFEGKKYLAMGTVKNGLGEHFTKDSKLIAINLGYDI